MQNIICILFLRANFYWLKKGTKSLNFLNPVLILVMILSTASPQGLYFVTNIKIFSRDWQFNSCLFADFHMSKFWTIYPLSVYAWYHYISYALNTCKTDRVMTWCLHPSCKHHKETGLLLWCISSIFTTNHHFHLHLYLIIRLWNDYFATVKHAARLC